MRILSLCSLLLITTGMASAAEPWTEFLNEPVLEKDQAANDVVRFVETRLPTLKLDDTPEAWQARADQLRATILDRVIYRGEAAAWRDADCRVEWLEEEPGGPGYRLQKLRYEALPGLWIPAILYIPEKLTGKVPVALNVNGHDPVGKAAEYKQMRCINMAKRGMLALNVEWLGMGQLRKPGYSHSRMNQLDLCGTSGLAPFYLSMKRGIDLLLKHPHADPERVAVAGLSGGGWQTIFISSLDTRVTLANPVAGYSTIKSHLHHWTDLGDSEQTPLDFATIADYSHLTALLAPRPTLLTYNVKDNCCFASGHALPPLLEAGRPAFALFGKADYLQHHVNLDPGTHNFEKDNREALYRMLAIHFSRPGDDWTLTEIGSSDELKTPDQLQVALPEVNADFNTLALDIHRKLPKPDPAPSDAATRDEWSKKQRESLRKLTGYRPAPVEAKQVRAETGDGWTARRWLLRQGTDWQFPVIDITPEGATQTQIVFADAGRKSLEETIASLLKEKTRVLAVDPFYFGECHIERRAYLFALLVNSVGERPLGIQASQLAALARWAGAELKSPIHLKTIGPRSSTIGLVAAAIEPDAFASLQSQEPLESLGSVLTESMSFDAAPELFCGGLLATHDLPQIRQLLPAGVLR
jgi:hypothetical protein